MTSPGDLRALETVRNNLTREFAGVFTPETVAACLAESYDRLVATATSIDSLSYLPSALLATA